jgi:hypothetical protein
MRKAVITLGLSCVLLASAFISSTVTSAQSATETPVPTSPSVSVFPSETWSQTYIAQQDFQHGYMFWISPRKEIWVLVSADAGNMTGEWQVFQDTFKDGEQEIDQSLVAPAGNLFQPRRGFGKIWRQPSPLFTALGWGTTEELEASTPISYLAGANGAPGRYLILTIGREIFSLNEKTAGQPGGTWTYVGKLTEGNPNQQNFTPTPVGAAPAAATVAPAATDAALGPVVTAVGTAAQ